MSVEYSGRYKQGPLALQFMLHGLGGFQVRALDLVSNRTETLPKVQFGFVYESLSFVISFFYMFFLGSDGHVRGARGGL